MSRINRRNIICLNLVFLALFAYSNFPARPNEPAISGASLVPIAETIGSSANPPASRSLAACISPNVSAFYVAPDGNDLNAGTYTHPFATLEAARSAMRAKPIKVTLIRAGHYLRSSPLVLTSADNGETWKGFECDPPRSAVFDGVGANHLIEIHGASDVTVDNIKLQNVECSGIAIHGGAPVADVASMNYATTQAAENIIQNIEVADIAQSGCLENVFSVGGVIAQGNVPGTKILNNYFHDSGGMGLGVRSQIATGDSISGMRIDRNVILNTNQIQSDGGAIYVEDFLAASTDIKVTNNFVRDYQGKLTDTGHCIYLDASTSNTIVQGNVCGPPGPSAAGQSAFISLCGNNIAWTNNIVDLGSGAETSVLELGTCRPPAVLTQMTKNVFEHNIIVANFSGTQKTHFADQVGYAFPTGGWLPNQPIIANNIYHNYAGGPEVTTGNLKSDESPIKEDPSCFGWTYQLANNSAAYPSNGFLAARASGTAWGPPEFSIPQNGTPPSCPH